MMGGHHAASGAAAWVAVSTVPYGLGVLPTDPAGVLTGALVCAGAALLPDLDHRRSTLARALPPVTSLAARVTERAAGGHRAGTHSIAGLVVAVLFAVLAGRTPWGPPVAALLLGTLALRALKVLPGPRWAWTAGLAAALAVGFGQPDQWEWFPVAVGLGVGAHILGDALTRGGVSLFWPLTQRRFAMPIVGRTGSGVEWLLMTPVSLYAVFGMLRAVAELVGVVGP